MAFKRSIFHLFILAVLLCLRAPAPALAAQNDAPGAIHVMAAAFSEFHARAISSAETNAKWQNVLWRHQIEMRRYARNVGTNHQNPAIHTWLAFISSLRGRNPKEQIKAVNAFFNHFRYATDQSLWGVPDYWATPAQFIAAGAGDCEDYAIAKYFTLRALGFSDDALRLTIVNDRFRHNIAHAILLVSLNGAVRVLDNQSWYVGTDADLVHYRPLYAVNKKSLWIYLPDSSRINVAAR